MKPRPTRGLPGYFRHGEYSIAPADIVRLMLGCQPDAVRARVVITPIWNAYLGPLEESNGKTVVPGRVWEVTHNGEAVTVIRSGIGAAVTGDVVLALGCTPCQALVFTGSVGGLDPNMEIGDLVVVQKSVSADGFTRYLSDAPAAPDKFLSDTWPDSALTVRMASNAAKLCASRSVALHTGAVISVDTIVAQFSRLEQWTAAMSLIGVEMETAATFTAAKLSGTSAVALLQVSDVIPAKKTLFAGRTQQDHQRRHWTRSTVLPEIILGTLTETAG